MSGIEEVLRGGLVGDDFLVVVACLVVLTGKEGAPSDWSPHFVASVEIVDFVEVLEGFVVVAHLEQAMSNAYQDGDIVGAEALVAAVVFEGIFGLLQRAVASGDTSYNPFAVGVQEVGAEVCMKGSTDVVGHLPAVANLLKEDIVLGVCFRKAEEDGEGIAEVVFVEIVFGEVAKEVVV